MENLLGKIGVKYSITIAICAVIFLIIALIGTETEVEELQAFSFFSVVILFFYGIYYSYNILKDRNEYIHLLPFVVLNWYIGCFSTNIFINIFENLPLWVYLVTLLYCLTLFVIYNKYEHKYLTPISYFVNGVSILLVLYYILFLIPFMIFSALGILALGLGFYGLVPLITFVIQLFTLGNIKPGSTKMFSFIAGIVTSFAVVITTTYLIDKEIKNINQYGVTKSFDINSDLPTYVKISQNYKPTFLNEVVLKKKIVYTNTDNFFNFNDFRIFQGIQFNERKIHNPLYNFAYYFSEELNIGTNDQIKILQSNFDKRLETEEQLWSGEDLITNNIKEDVQIFPETRLAYTEFTIDVATINKSIWNKEEGIYSFQLPENSVATSLSLWVNGVERKGVLTTKEKAKKAYNQIVGVEARDPSLMQWREGNRVVVRVFPISANLPRTFKCGFTTPLKVVNEDLVYDNITIKGPRISKTEVITRLQVDNQQKFNSDKTFELKNGYYIYENNGLDNWMVNLKVNNALRNNAFAWKDKVYETSPLEYETLDYNPSDIVVDINKHWNNEEVKKLLDTKKQLFYIHNNTKKELNYENFENVLALFQDLHYSLLPLYNFKEKSLIITKSNDFSVNFEELKDCNYLNNLKNNCKNKDLKVINISDEINPFWQTIKEQKYVTFMSQNLDNTILHLQKNQITLPISHKNGVNVENAQITIFEKDKENKEKNGNNDHIYRMYAFGKVMTEHVEQENDSVTNKYVALAQDANIVTPITSLIVLETDADYEKHGIEKNVNGLGNASVKNEGAVPEPHEWVLIFMCAVAIWYFYFKKNKIVFKH